MTARKPSTKKKKKLTGMAGLSQELGAIHQWMQDHEKHDDRRFEQGNITMATLATKNDLAVVAQEQKNDMTTLTKLLLDDNGQPKFATKQDMAPVLSLYQGSVFTKSLILGAAAIIGAIVGIGWGLYQLIGWARHIN